MRILVFLQLIITQRVISSVIDNFVQMDYTNPDLYRKCSGGDRYITRDIGFQLNHTNATRDSCLQQCLDETGAEGCQAMTFNELDRCVLYHHCDLAQGTSTGSETFVLKSLPHSSKVHISVTCSEPELPESYKNSGTNYIRLTDCEQTCKDVVGCTHFRHQNERIGDTSYNNECVLYAGCTQTFKSSSKTPRYIIYEVDEPTTATPTTSPTQNPTKYPSSSPTKSPTRQPTLNPTSSPTKLGDTPEPTASPSVSPTVTPTVTPTASPTIFNAENRILIEDGVRCDPSSSSTLSTYEDEPCYTACLKTYGCVASVFESGANECRIFEECNKIDSAGFITYSKYKPPPMGYSSWNHMFKNANQDDLIIQMNNMEQYGLIDVGYKMFHVDGLCTFKNWSDDGSAARDENDFLVQPTSCIPMGIPEYTNLIKSKGMIPSWYTPGSIQSCNGNTFRAGNTNTWKERVRKDIQIYKSWGVEHLKIDNCDSTKRPGLSVTEIIKYWDQMRREEYPELMIENCKYNCHSIKSSSGGPYGNGQVESKGSWQSYCPNVGETHRVYTDSRPWAGKIFTIADAIASRVQNSSPMSWVYGDALEVCTVDLMSNRYAYVDAIYTGNVNDLQINTNGLSDPDARNTNPLNLQFVQLGIWAIASSPLWLSTDIAQCDPEMISMLKNQDFLRMNQEYSGDPGERTSKTTKNGIQYSVWTKTVTTTTDSRVYHLVASQDEDVIANLDDFASLEEQCGAGTIKITLWDTPNTGYKSKLFFCTPGSTSSPSVSPSVAPSVSPSDAPSVAPSVAPSDAPSDAPTLAPSMAPSDAPTLAPSMAPNLAPTPEPTTLAPTPEPTTQATPSQAPTGATTQAPTESKGEEEERIDGIDEYVIVAIVGGSGLIVGVISFYFYIR